MSELSDLQLARNMLACLPEGNTKARLLATISDMEKEQTDQEKPKEHVEEVTSQMKGSPVSNGNATSASMSSSSSQHMTSSSADILEPAIKANISTKTGLETLAVALHCTLLREGFTCISSDNTAGQVRGFAAPVRDVSIEKLLPDGWNLSTEAISLQYRKNDMAGSKVFMMKLIQVDGEAVVHMGIKNGNVASSEFKMQGLGDQGDGMLTATGPSSPGGMGWAEVERLCKDIFEQFRQRVLFVLVPPAPKVEQADVQADARLQVQHQQSPPPQMQYPPANAPENPPGYWSPYGEGSEDPLRIGAPQIPRQRRGDFAGDVFPVPGPSGGGAGGLMGPDHPMFGGGNGGDIPGGMGGTGGLGMAPRFDPYGPPMPGMPGGPGRGMVDPQGGRGRGRVPEQPFGGPQPDHLRPPNAYGNNNNMFM